MQRWRVPLGFLCGALFVLFARPRPLTLVVGGLIALFGLSLRAWAAGHIRKNAELAVSLLGLLFAALFLGIYLPVMRVEAATLSQLFGENYRRYSEAVPLFLPRLFPYRDAAAAGAKFDASLYLRYREYRAALGLVVAWSLLALKAVFIK
jgi:hypothetical protein